MEKFNQDVQTLIGLQLSNRQLHMLQTYERELLEWNERINLTAIRDPEGIHIKHFLDSLTCILKMNGNKTGHLIDVGTGAGFPGLPIKIAIPQIQLTLVESIGKKAEFCRHIVAKLNLEPVSVIQARVEELGQDPRYREKHDWAVARAVANMSTLAEYLLPLVRIGGRIIVQKGESGPAEIQKAENAVQILGGHLRQVFKLTLPGIVEERYLIVIDKIATSPPQYPRRAGIPTKKPIP